MTAVFMVCGSATLGMIAFALAGLMLWVLCIWLDADNFDASHLVTMMFVLGVIGLIAGFAFGMAYVEELRTAALVITEGGAVAA